MTKLDTLLDTLEKLDAARTPGPWCISGIDGVICSRSDGLMKPVWKENNSAFIVAAVNSNAKLRQIIRVQREALCEIEKVEANRDAQEENEECSYAGELARQAISQVEKIL